MHSWPVHDAKARFSELLEASISEGPQMVTKHGKPAAVLVPIRQWEALQSAEKRTLKEILLDRTAPTAIAVPVRGKLKLRRV
jgi:prevent-host-death family protein